MATLCGELSAVCSLAGRLAGQVQLAKHKKKHELARPESKKAMQRHVHATLERRHFGAWDDGARDEMKSNHMPDPGGQSKKERNSDTLGSNSEIGRKLRQYYDEIVSQDVPDRFADLLSQLENREKKPAAGNGE